MGEPGPALEQRRGRPAPAGGSRATSWAKAGRSRGSRSSACVGDQREAAGPRREPRQPPRHVGADGEHRAAGGQRVGEHGQRALAAAVEHGPARRPPAPEPRGSDASAERPRRAPRTPRPGSSPARRGRSIGAGAHGRAWPSTSRGSTAPFQTLRSSRKVASSGCRSPPGNRPSQPKATARARAPPGADREAGVAPLPHRSARRRSARRARAARLRGFPIPHGSSCASSSASAKPELRAGDDRVDALDRLRAAPGSGPARRGARTPRAGARPRSASMVRPAAARWPP